MENKQLVPGHQLVGIQDFRKRDSIHSTIRLWLELLGHNREFPWLVAVSGWALAWLRHCSYFSSVFLSLPSLLSIYPSNILYPYLFYSIFRKVFIRIKQNCRRFKQSVCKRRTSSPSTLPYTDCRVFFVEIALINCL